MSAFSTQPDSLSECRVRFATEADVSSVRAVYAEVAKHEGGIARKAHEISDAYIQAMVSRSLLRGMMMVAEYAGKTVGCVHAYQPEPQVFSHVLYELTILVHPELQGKGIGRAMFEAFLAAVRTTMPYIMRVELMARESNRRAHDFYASLGFVLEGRMKGRVQSVGGGYEDDLLYAWMNPGFAG